VQACVETTKRKENTLQQQRSPSQVFALVFGLILTVLGIIGFFYNASFAAGSETLHNREAIFGVFDVNGWHNVFHIITGIVGLALVGSALKSRGYALAIGALYVAFAILGIIYVATSTDSVFELIPVNTWDNVLHAFVGVCGLTVGLASYSEPTGTRVPPAGASPA
jgi:vacuolar-type H+-ATPase subunit I/STV1